MNPIFPDLKISRQILQAEVDEGPNEHLSLVTGHINDVYFCKSALKMGKIETLGASGGQVSSFKSFKCDWGSKRNFQIWSFLDFTVPMGHSMSNKQK
jgi:hypothetical protein